MGDLDNQVKQLVDTIIERVDGSQDDADLRAVRNRLDQPLRVAIAGRVKAGKSTLLNALVGEQLAPTDAGECTKIVTWYRHGPTYRVTLDLIDGSTRTVPFSRQSGAIEVDLQTLTAADVRRIVIEWPSRRLEDITLIDTPGVGSINAEVSARTVAFLTPDDDRPVEADAVLYLMRHMHADDLSFLESFHDDELAHASPINAIGLLSRADEIGVGRPNAMRVADRISLRYRSDPRLRRLCQTVRPIGGLLAETAATLTENEFRLLEQLALLDRRRIDALLLSADRFTADLPVDFTADKANPTDPTEPGRRTGSSEVTLTPLARRHLLDRFGLYGVRVTLPMIRQGRVTSAGELAEALEKKSGIVELRQDLLERFAARRNVLQARSALAAVERLLAMSGPKVQNEFLPEVERIRSGAHAMAEIRLLNDYRRGLLDLTVDDGAEMERLLGTDGHHPTDRLGLDSDADPDTVRRELVAAIDKWRRRGEHPLASREVVNAATVVVRTCEGTLAALG